LLARRNLRSVNITDEVALTEAVDRTAVALGVVAAPMAVEDSAAAPDISAARVMVAGCQPHLGTGVAVQIEVSVH